MLFCSSPKHVQLIVDPWRPYRRIVSGALMVLGLGTMACSSTQFPVAQTPMAIESPTVTLSPVVPTPTLTLTLTPTSTPTSTPFPTPTAAPPPPASSPTAAPTSVPTATMARPTPPTATPTPAPPKLKPGDSTAGKALYEQNCASCHGSRGEGYIGDRLIGIRLSVEEVIQLVRTPRGMMASFSPERLSDQQIVDIYTFILTLRGG